jgi:segregation and condensation protein B
MELPSPHELVALVEALAFSSGEPLRSEDVVSAFEGLTASDVEDAVRVLEQRYRRDGGGLRIEHVAGGIQIATRPELGPWVRQVFRQRNRTRLTLAALETLAVVAYRQPVTAPEIQAVRGRDPSASLSTLLEKGLVRILGKKKVVGRPILYGTTPQFLTHFGLNRLEDLPSMEEFERLSAGLAGAAGPVDGSQVGVGERDGSDGQSATED